MASPEPVEEDPIFGDWGPSQHNDGQGIRLKITFYPFNKDKATRRKNAKAVSITKISQVHEDYGLSEFLVSVLRVLSHLDLLDSSASYSHAQGNGEFNEDSTDGFSLTYSIIGTGEKDISITSCADYRSMIQAVVVRKSPQLALVIREPESLYASHLAHT
ncbi:hypothetical protein FA95DRAFT_1577238 [Auriscalpium vulgare]|uniref:Uncharacterized protein n=1 Tax=Auriscalpium vulgare TaxID=40419 RepID=A0ACB8R795_9AGAM|nr:hypothetical protein FA95DRAFT_1577238 [Auriscalpium vulgare]